MQKHYLEDLIEPVVTNLGYELVRVITIGQATPTLQVLIDTLDHKTDITVDDCAKVSTALSDVLDAKDPIESKYSLEVSSPGLDRPLTKPEHFARFVGYEVKLETEDKVENRKRFKGKITQLTLPEDNTCYYMYDFTNRNLSMFGYVSIGQDFRTYFYNCSR